MSDKSWDYFHPEFMSLLQPHPLYSTCGDNSFEVSKALVQARMLSGRYRTDKLLSYFDKHEDQRCRLCFCETGDIEHLLVHCTSLSDVRYNQLQSLNNRRDLSQVSVDIILDYWERPVSQSEMQKRTNGTNAASVKKSQLV